MASLCPSKAPSSNNQHPEHALAADRPPISSEEDPQRATVEANTLGNLSKCYVYIFYF